MKIYIRSYNPFVVGGSCTRDIAIEVDEPDWTDIGKGFYGAVVTSPHGKQLIVEKTSGGVVGENLQQVKDDIDCCEDISFLLEQVNEGKLLCKEAVIVSPEVFFAE